MNQKDNGLRGRETELLVNSFCSKLFLDHWTFCNPINESGKELCDCLILFHGSVIIISIKDCRGTKDETRWYKRAVLKSKKQIDGAERYLASGRIVKTSGGKIISIPNLRNLVTIRIGIALGYVDSFRAIDNVVEEDEGKYYHWFDDLSFSLVFRYIVTFSNFLKYLGHRENYYCCNESPARQLNDFGLLGLFLSEKMIVPVKGDDYKNASSQIWEVFLSSEECEKLFQQIQKNEYFCILIRCAFERLLDQHESISSAEMILEEFACLPLKSRCIFIDKYVLLKDSREQICDYLEIQCPASNKRKGIVLLVDGPPIVDDYSGERHQRQNKLVYFCDSLCKSNHWESCIGFATNKHKEKFGFSADFFYLEENNNA